jgi:hypothetical protein
MERLQAAKADIDKKIKIEIDELDATYDQLNRDVASVLKGGWRGSIHGGTMGRVQVPETL